METIFPINGSGVCTNNTDCGRGGRCIVRTSNDEMFCRCPILYDPLDRCTSFYYDRSGILVHLINFFIVLAANLTFIYLIRIPIGKEIHLIRRKGCGWRPRPMTFVLLSNVCLSSTNVIVAVMYVLRDMRAERVQAVGITIFTFTFFLVDYFFIMLQIETKELGSVEKKWYILGVLILVLSGVGLGASLIVGFFEDQIDRPIIGTIGQIVGLVFPLLISIGMKIYSIVWVVKRDHKTKNTFIIIWRLLWISIALSVWLCVLYFTLLIYNRSVASMQLFGNITILEYLVTGLYIVAQALFVAFVLNTRRKKQSTASNPEILNTSKGSTNKSSSTPISTRASTDSTKEMESTVARSESDTPNI